MSTDLNDIEFEFTAPNSPQFNGKIERKFATLIKRVRAMLNAAKLTQELRHLLWCEAAATATDVENLLVSRNDNTPARTEFFEKDLAKADSLRQFGEMAIIKIGNNIKGKLDDRGIPVMYLGREKDHAADTYRMLNIATKRVLISRDAIWLNKVFGVYEGSHSTPLLDTITVIPDAILAKKIYDAHKDLQPENKVNNDEHQPHNNDEIPVARENVPAVENLPQNVAHFEDGGPQPPTPRQMVRGTTAPGMHTRQQAKLSADGETTRIGV